MSQYIYDQVTVYLRANKLCNSLFTTYKCIYCFPRTQQRKDFSVHTCSYCQKKFSESVDAIRHSISLHPENKVAFLWPKYKDGAQYVPQTFNMLGKHVTGDTGETGAQWINGSKKFIIKRNLLTTSSMYMLILQPFC
jgi:hypothetical protein